MAFSIFSPSHVLSVSCTIASRYGKKKHDHDLSSFFFFVFVVFPFSFSRGCTPTPDSPTAHMQECHYRGHVCPEIALPATCTCAKMPTIELNSALPFALELLPTTVTRGENLRQFTALCSTSRDDPLSKPEVEYRPRPSPLVRTTAEE